MRLATDLAGELQHAYRMERTFPSSSRAGICSMIDWRNSGGISCSSRPITPASARSRNLPSRTNVPLLAHAGGQVLAFRDVNERVHHTRLLTKQGPIVRPGDTAISGACRDEAMDPPMTFTREKLV
jgi:hypothetical protein